MCEPEEIPGIKTSNVGEEDRDIFCFDRPGDLFFQVLLEIDLILVNVDADVKEQN